MAELESLRAGTIEELEDALQQVEVRASTLLNSPSQIRMVSLGRAIVGLEISCKMVSSRLPDTFQVHVAEKVARKLVGVRRSILSLEIGGIGETLDRIDQAVATVSGGEESQRFNRLP